VSTVPEERKADTVAGFLCAFSFVLAGLALVQRPGLLAPAAILVALVAVRMTESHRRLAGAAVLFSGLAFFLGMVIAISTNTSLY
jgi:ABC-type Mn2+/Zn2+ transport system permease subunit